MLSFVRRPYPSIMDNNTISSNNNPVIISTVHQKTPTKRTKPNNKKKPIKVVYISNPMKVSTSASEFRALVQELTGQYAESPPDPSRFQISGGDSGENRLDYDKNDSTHVVPPPVDVDLEGESGGASSSFENFEPFDDVIANFEPFDEVFTPHDQMVDNISALIPASVLYESPLLGHHW